MPANECARLIHRACFKPCFDRLFNLKLLLFFLFAKIRATGSDRSFLSGIFFFFLNLSELIEINCRYLET